MQLSDNANFCFKCGKPQNAGQQLGKHISVWEYKELRIPLGIEARVPGVIGRDQAGAVRQAAIDFGSQANSRITTVLQNEGAGGWQPDGSTDLFSLLVAGQVSWRDTTSVLSLSWKFRFDSVVIRFKRMT
jgi:hypothetical protein